MSMRIAHLGELCQMHRQGLRPDDPLASRLRFVGVENVGAGTGIVSFDTGSRVGSQKSTAFRFDERHVLYAKLRPYLNKVATPGFAGRCSTELVPLLPRDGVDRDFLAHLLRRSQTVEFVMASVTGTQMPRTDMKALMSMPVPFPPFDDQRRISSILNRAAHIERLRVLATDRLREFIPALFIKMFGDPIENPMGWEVEPLGTYCVLTQYGTSKKPNDRAAGMPIVRMGNVTYDGHLDCATLKHVELAESDAEKYALRAGDILFNRTNSKDLVGKTGIWDGRFEATAASYFIRLRVNEVVLCPVYVWAFMNSSAMKRRLFDTARGAVGQANINAKELQSLPLPVPPINLQTRYTEIIASAYGLATTAETASNTASALIASLMSLLLGDSA